ncbi:MAG: cyclic nucleotide-binding domain-containing protein [Xanthobacteraceae bacterium]
MAMVDTAIDFGLLTGAGAAVRAYNAGDVIFRQGDKAEELFVIQSGTVEIRLGNRLLDTLPERSIFGEMALIDGAPRSATAIAATDVKLVPVGEKQFLFLVSRTPYFALNVMPALARRLRATNDALWSMIRKSGSRFSEKIMRY